MAIIYSRGFQQSITNDGSKSKPVMNIIEWDADYKNNKGKMNVNINKNGKKNNYQVKLNKNDLENILKMPIVNESLDQRLMEDFPIPILDIENQFTQQLPSIRSKTRKNMRNIAKQNITTEMIENNKNNKNNNQYNELEDLFALRKKLIAPYHLTHHSAINKTRKARQAKQQAPKQKKVNNKKSRKNNNKAKGMTKFFNKFF
uniref:Uncharacterized protein n=1 Tax=viral metagenome TaxID=1070528 RepID=A0A6C0HAQ2_9ZZZZ